MPAPVVDYRDAAEPADEHPDGDVADLGVEAHDLDRLGHHRLHKQTRPDRLVGQHPAQGVRLGERTEDTTIVIDHGPRGDAVPGQQRDRFRTGVAGPTRTTGRFVMSRARTKSLL